MATKESKIVEIASSKELAKFLKDFSNGGGIGVQRNGDRYFVSTLDKIVEIRPVFRGDMKEAQNLLDQIEYCFDAPRRNDQIQLNEQYNGQCNQ